MGRPSAALLVGAALAALTAPSAQGSPHPLPLFCDLSDGLATGFVAIDSEAGEADGSDVEECALGMLASESMSTDEEGAVRYALRAEARLWSYTAEVENELELEADAPASGSLSTVASVAFGASAQKGAQLLLHIARDGVPGTLSARVEAGGDVETYDLSGAPAGVSWIELPDETVYVTIEAAAALSAPGSSRQTLRADVMTPEPAAPLLAGVAALTLVGRAALAFRAD